MIQFKINKNESEDLLKGLKIIFEMMDNDNIITYELLDSGGSFPGHYWRCYKGNRYVDDAQKKFLGFTTEMVVEDILILLGIAKCTITVEIGGAE